MSDFPLDAAFRSLSQHWIFHFSQNSENILIQKGATVSLTIMAFPPMIRQTVPRLHRSK
jgi:hypothetical protein